MTNHTLTAVTSITNAIREDQDRGSEGLSKTRRQILKSKAYQLELRSFHQILDSTTCYTSRFQYQ